VGKCEESALFGDSASQVVHRGLQQGPALPSIARIDWEENHTCQSRRQMQNVWRREEENRVIERNGEWC